jgi:hypothetical protein
VTYREDRACSEDVVQFRNTKLQLTVGNSLWGSSWLKFFPVFEAVLQGSLKQFFFIHEVYYGLICVFVVYNRYGTAKPEEREVDVWDVVSLKGKKMLRAVSSTLTGTSRSSWLFLLNFTNQVYFYSLPLRLKMLPVTHIAFIFQNFQASCLFDTLVLYEDPVSKRRTRTGTWADSPTSFMSEK